MVETPRLEAKFLFAIGLTTLSILPPCGGGGRDEGEKGFMVHPHPCLPAGRLTLPHHRRGRGF